MAPSPFCQISDTRILVGATDWKITGTHAAELSAPTTLYLKFNYGSKPVVCVALECFKFGTRMGYQLKESLYAVWDSAVEAYTYYSKAELHAIPLKYGAWVQVTRISVLVRVTGSRFVEAQIEFRGLLDAQLDAFCRWALEDEKTVPTIYAIGYSQYKREFNIRALESE